MLIFRFRLCLKTLVAATRRARAPCRHPLTLKNTRISSARGRTMATRPHHGSIHESFETEPRIYLIFLCMIVVLSGCELLVDFDRSAIVDAGPDGKMPTDAAIEDAGADARADAAIEDAGADAPDAEIPDANIVEDGGSDAGHDAGLDAGHDAGFDAGHDAGFDAGHDAGFDAGHDAGFDAGHDAGHDAGFDAGYDAGFDAGHDAGFDAGHDAGFDAGFDAA